MISRSDLVKSKLNLETKFFSEYNFIILLPSIIPLKPRNRHSLCRHLDHVPLPMRLGYHLDMRRVIPVHPEQQRTVEPHVKPPDTLSCGRLVGLWFGWLLVVLHRLLIFLVLIKGNS
jgi:hypothetical protein